MTLSLILILESNSNARGNSLQENEFRTFSRESTIPIQEIFLESMETFTIESNLRVSQEMSSIMTMMHWQINWAIRSAIDERVLPKIENVVSSPSSGNGSLCPVRHRTIKKIVVEQLSLNLKLQKRTVGLTLI